METNQNALTNPKSMTGRLWPDEENVLPYFSPIRACSGRLSHVDATDRKILAELQQDGRLSVTELAERIQLSVSPCHRRVRALERAGAIAGYRASLDPKSLGLGFEAMVFVTMASAASPTLDAFEGAVHDSPNILDAQRLFGEPDYLLRVVARDLADFQRIYDNHLAKLPGVQKLRSTLVMKTIVENGPLPL